MHCEDSEQEAMEVDEEDGPFEDWTVKELKEECKTIESHPPSQRMRKF